MSDDEETETDTDTETPTEAETEDAASEADEVVIEPMDSPAPESTAPKAAAALPRALRNAMLTEQLYFCDSLRAIL